MKNLKFTKKPDIALYAMLCLVFLCVGCTPEGSENDTTLYTYLDTINFKS